MANTDWFLSKMLDEVRRFNDNYEAVHKLKPTPTSDELQAIAMEPKIKRPQLTELEQAIAEALSHVDVWAETQLLELEDEQ